MKKILLVFLILIILIFSGCSNKIEDKENSSKLANPASEKCIEDGYKLEIREDASGNQYGVCIFLDNSECEEWAYFRGECQ